MINGTWRRSLQDVRVKRGADVGSDHPPSCHGNRKGEAEEKRTWQGKTQQFDVQKLKEPKSKSTFSFQLKNKFRALEDAESHTTLGTSDINTMREQIIHTPAKPAWDSDGRKRRSGLRGMPASYREQGSPEVQSNGHQIKEAERQIWAAVPRNRPDS